MPVEAIAAAIRDGSNSALAPTGLICLENTHNAAGGMVLPLDYMADVKDLASDAGLPVHLDGARLFNAATYLDVPVATVAEHVDSLMFAVCKGLGAPVGAVLAGEEKFIAAAWRVAKMLGGGMRQAGLLAAPAIVALQNPYKVHRRDHALAKKLAEGLADIDASLVAVDKVHTNIVNCFVDRFASDAGRITAALRARGIRVNTKGTKIRFVTHYEVGDASVEAAVAAMAEILQCKGEAA